MHLPPPSSVAKAAVHSKAVALMFFSWLLLPPLFVGALCLILVLLLSTLCLSFAIILMGKRKLVALI